MPFRTEYYIGTNEARSFRIEPVFNEVQKKNGAVAYVNGTFITAAQARIMATTLLKLADKVPWQEGAVQYLPSGEQEEA